MKLGYFYPLRMGTSGKTSGSLVTRARKKVLSTRPGEVAIDFPAGQSTFHSHLPDRQEPRQVIH